jgi:hypothetical protein
MPTDLRRSNMAIWIIDIAGRVMATGQAKSERVTVGGLDCGPGTAKRPVDSTNETPFTRRYTSSNSRIVFRKTGYSTKSCRPISKFWGPCPLKTKAIGGGSFGTRVADGKTGLDGGDMGIVKYVRQGSWRALRESVTAYWPSCLISISDVARAICPATLEDKPPTRKRIGVVEDFAGG